MGEVKLIVLFSKKIYPHLNNIFDVRIISEEGYDNFPEPVLAAKTNENISQKWS
jgi:hypothetical protein